MKTLNDYTNEATTELLNEMGAFYAFGEAQFNEQKKECVEYTQLQHGLICPVENANEYIKCFSELVELGIKKDLEENGKDKIIWRELANYETQITGDISDTVESVEIYGITREEVQEVYVRYFEHCCENDLF